MRTHRDTPKLATQILSVIIDAANDPEAPVFVAPGTYRGHKATVVFIKNDEEGDRIALAPVAVILDPSEAAHVTTIDGLTRTGESGAPSGPSGAQDGEAVKVLRDVMERERIAAQLSPVLRERAERVLAGNLPAAPAAASTGVYL